MRWEPSHPDSQNGRAEELPLDELPDLRLQLVCLTAHFGEDRDRALQVHHRLVRTSLGLQEIGEVVLKGGLTVAITLSLAQG